MIRNESYLSEKWSNLLSEVICVLVSCLAHTCMFDPVVEADPALTKSKKSSSPPFQRCLRLDRVVAHFAEYGKTNSIRSVNNSIGIFVNG